LINVDKQIEYWSNISADDIETAEILIEKKKYKEGLFFYHLSIEKLLKAIYVKKITELAPKTHNLIYLSNKSSLEISDEQILVLNELHFYQLEGRYPENSIKQPNIEFVLSLTNKVKELRKWLMLQL
jgi:HEPN domain-containing protein